MILSMLQFRQALLAPTRHFRTLGALRCVASDPKSMVRRTARFAEAEVILPDGGHALLYSPLSPSAVIAIERVAHHLRSLQSEWLMPYTLLYDEVEITDLTGARRSGDIVVQRLPAGVPLSCEWSIEGGRLARMVTELRSEMVRLGFTHNNLKAENIIVGDDLRLHPIRYHYATLGGCRDDFRHLFALAAERGGSMVEDCAATYTFAPAEPMAYAHEGLVRTLRDGRYGFTDESGCEVIECRYLWADDFCEGRSVVESDEGVGVINRRGEALLPTHFDSVDYDKALSRFVAWLDGVAYRYDYNGRLCEK